MRDRDLVSFARANKSISSPWDVQKNSVRHTNEALYVVSPGPGKMRGDNWNGLKKCAHYGSDAEVRKNERCMVSVTDHYPNGALLSLSSELGYV